MSTFLRLAVCCSMLLLAGCYKTPVRHLSSDVVLIQEDASTRDDVLLYLGEPDDIEMGKNGIERWIYRDSRRTVAEDAPWVGKYFGSPEITTVTVTLNKNIVTDCDFGSRDKDDLEWRDDFKWQRQLNHDGSAEQDQEKNEDEE